jgi:hypothetical protein
MPQCKVPLDWQKPNINICILEKGHEGPHNTYGLGWGQIKYSLPNDFLENRGIGE